MRRFRDKPRVLHIEVGSGRGDFGRRYHPRCFLTDVDERLVTVHRVRNLDRICDVHSLPWGDGRFSLVIICNPYGYGFRDSVRARSLLAELSRVLAHDGKVLLIGRRTNPYCAPRRVERAVIAFNGLGGFQFTFGVNALDTNADFPGYVFETSGFTPTIPNFKAELVIGKH